MSKIYNISQEEFDQLLTEVMDEESCPSALLFVPGVYEAVSEHYNNEVLRRWENKQEAREEEE